MPVSLLTSAVASVLVGILKSIGWQSLIIKVGSDTLHYAAKKFDNVLVQKTLDNLGTAIEQAKPKEP